MDLDLSKHYTVIGSLPSSDDPTHHINIDLNYDEISLIHSALVFFISNAAQFDEYLPRAEDMKLIAEIFDGLEDRFE